MDWFDLLTVQGTLKFFLQHHSSKKSILQHSAFLIVQLSHPYKTTGKTIALTIETFVGEVTSLLFNYKCLGLSLLSSKEETVKGFHDQVCMVNTAFKIPLSEIHDVR